MRFCSSASARCWSDFTAPSVLPRIAGDLGVREAEHELQRQHLALLGRELLDQLEHPGVTERVERLVLGRRLLRAARLGDVLLGCTRRPARK